MSLHRHRFAPKTALCATVVACVFVLLPATASARHLSFGFEPEFSLNSHLGEGGTYTVGFELEGTEYYGHVTPLTGLTIDLPEGVGLSDAGFPTCATETLQRYEPERCPAGSRAGPEGTVTMFVALAGEMREETAEVRPIFGTGGKLYLWIEGESPVKIEKVAEGTYSPGSPPYGATLHLNIPLIETVYEAPLASITAMTLTLGATREEGGTERHSVTLPAECAAGYFSWGLDAFFHEEGSELQTTTSACPASGSRRHTTTVLKASNPTPLLHEAVTYTATVTPTSSAAEEPSGTVTFLDETAPIAGCTEQPLTQGTTSSTATCRVAYSAYGVHGISATYGGDTNYLGSSSLTETVTLSSAAEELLHKHNEGTSGAGSGSTVSAQSTVGTSSGGGSTATISTTQIRTALLGLTPEGKAAAMLALLKHGGLSSPFNAPTAGTLSVKWYDVPAGAKLAKKAKPVLVASGHHSFAGAGTGSVRITLTAQGKHLLKHSKHLKLTGQDTFTPTGGTPVSAEATFVFTGR